MTKREYDDFVAELVQMKFRAGQLGLWKTMHALDEATKAVGWEPAAQLVADTTPTEPGA